MPRFIDKVIGLSALRLFEVSQKELLKEEDVKRLLSRHYCFFFGVDRCFDGLRKYGIFQIWTKEFIDALVVYLRKSLSHPDALILDAGAGNGTLTFWLKKYGFNVVAVDNRSKEWKFSHSGQIPNWVVNMSVKDALNEYQPEIVIASWMPPISFSNFHEEWTRHFQRCASVKEYILIGEPPRKGYSVACGDRRSWGKYPDSHWSRKDLLKLTSLSLSYLDFLRENQKGRKSIVCSFKRT